MIIRSWNVYHGRSHPPDRMLTVESAVRLASADRPTVLCLQELPVWSLGWLEAWTDMTAVTVVTRRASLGPVPIPAELGRGLVELNPPLFRSAFCGQGNAVLLDRELDVLQTQSLVLNERSFRRREARRIGLSPAEQRAWAQERRVCQAVRAALPDGRRAVVANVHASGIAGHPDVADAEVLRAASFADALAAPEDVVALAGDFNIDPKRSRVLEELAGPEWGFSRAGPGIDHVLVRGADSSDLEVWPLERRRLNGRLLSDHAPVEVRLG